MLCLTQPDAVRSVHAGYLEAGADLIETNTFNANAVSLADYEASHLAREINVEAARLACEAGGSSPCVSCNSADSCNPSTPA